MPPVRREEAVVHVGWLCCRPYCDQAPHSHVAGENRRRNRRVRGTNLSDGIFALVAIQLGSIIGRISSQAANGALQVTIPLAA